MRAIGIMILLSVSMLWAQQGPVTPGPSKDFVYVCPMDRDIRSHDPGNCSRCGMKLVAGIPEPAEFHLDLTVAPRPVRPHEKTHLKFEVHDPWKNNPVKKFTVVHEKLFHAFVIGPNLQFFVHDHPNWENDAFHYDIIFPQPGMYRVLGDFYPEAATPQLITKTVLVAGTAPQPVSLKPDFSTKTAENLKVEFSTIPAQPIAGSETQLRFRLSPGDGLEKYLGAWGHMLAASDDLIDMMHTHPYLADGSSDIQFHLVFPRSRTYRVWVQFQRNGVVNTAHFDVPAIAPSLEQN